MAVRLREHGSPRRSRTRRHRSLSRRTLRLGSASSQHEDEETEKVEGPTETVSPVGGLGRGVPDLSSGDESQT